jgi:hypothetical protein
MGRRHPHCFQFILIICDSERRLGLGSRHFRRMLENAFRAGIVNKSGVANETFQHGRLAPGAKTVR